MKKFTLLGCWCVAGWLAYPNLLQDRPQSLLIERRWSVNHESIGFSGLESTRDRRRGGERELGKKKKKKKTKKML
jgi:hypothetical protein